MTIPEDIRKRFKGVAAVVENSIQDNFNILFVALLNQFNKINSP